MGLTKYHFNIVYEISLPVSPDLIQRDVAAATYNGFDISDGSLLLALQVQKTSLQLYTEKIFTM